MNFQVVPESEMPRVLEALKNKECVTCYAPRDDEGFYCSKCDPPTCPYCKVDAGYPHEDGCDVARCALCGWQRISCEHEDDEGGWGHIWTGEWPGDAEVAEGLATDLNHLAMLSRSGQLAWDGQRWQKPELTGEGE